MVIVYDTNGIYNFSELVFAIQDMYNYGNYDEEKRLRVNVSIGYLKKANRFAVDMEKKKSGYFLCGRSV